MPAPKITFRAQTRLDKTITVSFVVSDPSATVTAALPAAAVPNGAVGRPAMAVVPNTAGECAPVFTALPYGDYGFGIVTATNADGTTTATFPTSEPFMRLFAPGTAPVGTPRALLPPFVAPAFATPTLAMGAVVTTVEIESTASASEASVPFTFGQPFEAGHLAPTDHLVGRIAGEADIPLQFNVKATHPDGSVRHAIISGLLPTLDAGQVKTVELVRAASGTSTVPAASPTLLAGGFAAQLSATFDDVVYITAVNGLLGDGLPASDAWIGGAIATEYIINMPFKHSTTGAEHPYLTAQYAIRRYAGTNKAKVDVTFEHTKAYLATSDLIYTGQVRIANVTQMQVTGADGGLLTHFPGARWHRTFWWNNSNPVHIRHNVAYLLGSMQLPNYDQRLTVPEHILQKYVADMASPSFGLMGEGAFARAFGGTGGRPDIGLAPGWYAAYVLSQDKRAKKMMLSLADCGGSWGIHQRDTSTGPGKGLPLSVVNFPRATIKGSTGDSRNTASGLYEKLPGTTTVSELSPDASHQPAFAYIPYLATGDFYYLEELQFWGAYNLFDMNPGASYRGAEKGLVFSLQVRGQGWCIRTMAQCAAITPDQHPLKPAHQYFLSNNMSWFNSQYTDNPDANKLGIVVNGPAVIYDIESPVLVEDVGIGTFQDDFVVQAVGHASELGFPEATRFLRWKAKFQVGRMIAPGYCWINAAPFALFVRETSTSPFFETLAQCEAATLSAAIRALPCNSPERLQQYILETGNDRTVVGEMYGYGSSVIGFPANYQPALAMAADSGAVEDADLAWDLFESRTVKPAYGESPQFAIVPRGIASYAPPPEPDPEDPGAPSPGVRARYARPAADVSAGGWAASAGGTLASAINEAVPANTDSIQATAPGIAEIKLEAVVPPGPYTGQEVRYQAWGDNGGALTVQLKQGAAVVAQWYHANLPLTPTTFYQRLTSEQRASITDYTDLRCSFITT